MTREEATSLVKDVWWNGFNFRDRTGEYDVDLINKVIDLLCQEPINPEPKHKVKIHLRDFLYYLYKRKLIDATEFDFEIEIYGYLKTMKEPQSVI